MHQSVLSAWRCSNWLLLAALFIVPASQARSPDDPAAAPQATRAIYTVGEQADCDFSNLQDAIHAATPGDTIRIARSTGHLGNTYTLYGKSLTLRGGFDSCNAGETPSGRTTLDADGANLPVLDIWQGGTPPDQMRVVLRDLDLRRGNGGLKMEGQLGRLSVQLQNTGITENTSSTSGGGIKVLIPHDSAHDGNAQPLLRIDNDSQISHNSSDGDGGGIYCWQPSGTHFSRIIILVGNALISHNTAANGGGVSSHGCTSMYFDAGAPLLSGVPTGGIYMNDASFEGGGLHARNGGSIHFSGSSSGSLGAEDHAATMMGNSAGYGGAAAVMGSNSNITLRGVLATGNTANQDGGVALAHNGGRFHMGALTNNRSCPPPPDTHGDQAFPPCSYAIGNSAGGHGGVLRVLNSSYADISQSYILQNEAMEGGSVISVNSAQVDGNEFASALIESSLLSGNNGVTLVFAGNDSQINLYGNTISGNQVGSLIHVHALDGATSRSILESSIIWGNDTPLMLTRSDTGNTLAGAECVIGSQPESTSGLTSAIAYLHSDPLFADAPGGDYRLLPSSPAIDFCDDRTHYSNSSGHDLAGNIRGVLRHEPAHVPNPALGLYDLGAFEAQSEMGIFADSFE